MSDDGLARSALGALVPRVRAMREQQRLYFSTRDASVLRQCKAAEAAVDKMLDELARKGLA